MAMDESVICLSFSRDSEQLVSGSTDGKIAASTPHTHGNPSLAYVTNPVIFL